VALGEEVSPPFERPSADVVAELVLEDYLWYTICRVEDGYVARLPWIADFAITADLKNVTCHPVASGNSNLIPIVVPGTIVAFLLALRGQCVLHGSAVEMGGRALAFIGRSGQGKSTMAAIFSASGAALVTDDVLPLEFDESTDTEDTVLCVRSGNQIRLREKAATLADRFGEDALVSLTADARHAVLPTCTQLDRVPLAAVILPRPDREHFEVSARVLSAGEASLLVGRCQRIEGWHGPDHLRQQFFDVARVVAAVPVFEVSIPWGPPFANGLAQQVLEACQLDRALSRRTAAPDRR
jgi:hypothetical protein